jgi:hypothetical protein
MLTNSGEPSMGGRSSSESAVVDAQAVLVLARDVDLRGVHRAHAELRDGSDMRHLEQPRGDAGVRGAAALVLVVEIGVGVDLHDVDRLAQPGECVHHRDGHGVIAAGAEHGAAPADLLADGLAIARRRLVEGRTRRQIAEVEHRRGEIDAELGRRVCSSRRRRRRGCAPARESSHDGRTTACRRASRERRAARTPRW